MIAVLIVTLFPLGVYLWFTMGTTFLAGRNRVLLPIWETAIVLFFCLSLDPKQTVQKRSRALIANG